MVRKLLLLGLLLLTPLAAYPFLKSASTPNITYVPPEQLTKTEEEKAREFGELAKTDPIEFLQRCLNRYEKEVTGYTCLFDKREKVNGKLRQQERISIHFREKPFSVHMEWVSGWDPIGARRTLYVEGENDGLLKVRVLHPDLGLILDKKIDAEDVMATSRFPISEFGMYKGARATIAAMRKAKDNGTLHVKYEGIMKVKEAGDRDCYKLVRTPYNPPEDDGCNELIIYIDVKTHLQVGSILKDSDGKLIATYFFHNIDLKPKFDEEQFTKSKV